MATHPVGTAVNVVYSGLGYNVECAGQIVAAQGSFPPEAADDMPPIDGPDLYHVALIVISGGGVSSNLATNLSEGNGVDQFTVA